MRRRSDMKSQITLVLTLAMAAFDVGTLIGNASSARAAEGVATPLNTLNDAEKAAGWKLLFDGKTLNGWHNFKKEGVRPGWEVKDGTLVCVDPHNAGDIV